MVDAIVSFDVNPSLELKVNKMKGFGGNTVERS